MTPRLARGSAPRRIFAPAAERPLASYSAQATVDKRPGMAYKHAKAEAVSAQRRGTEMLHRQHDAHVYAWLLAGRGSVFHSPTIERDLILYGTAFWYLCR